MPDRAVTPEETAKEVLAALMVSLWVDFNADPERRMPSEDWTKRALTTIESALAAQAQRDAEAVARVREFAVRDASFGDDRLLHLLHDVGLITEAEAGGWLAQFQHPSFRAQP